MNWEAATLILLTYMSFGCCQNGTTEIPVTGTATGNTTVSIPATVTTPASVTPVTCYSCPTGVATQVCANVAVPAVCTNEAQSVCALIMRRQYTYGTYGWEFRKRGAGHRRGGGRGHGRGRGRGRGRNRGQRFLQTFNSTCEFCNQYSNSTDAFLFSCCTCSLFG